MMDAFAILASLISGATLLAVGALSRRVNKAMHDAHEVEKAKAEILKCTARRDIFDAYERYIVRAEKMSVARFDEIEREYHAYTVLGGNGTAKRYMEALEGQRPFLITE